MFNSEDWDLGIEPPTHCSCCGHEYTLEEPLCPKMIAFIERIKTAVALSMFNLISKACEENNV